MWSVSTHVQKRESQVEHAYHVRCGACIVLLRNGSIHEHHLTPHDGVAICRWVDEHQMCILSALLGLTVNSRYNVAFYIGGLLPTNIPIP
jgi:hypothetical protein